MCEVESLGVFLYVRLLMKVKTERFVDDMGLCRLIDLLNVKRG